MTRAETRRKLREVGQHRAPDKRGRRPALRVNSPSLTLTGQSVPVVLESAPGRRLLRMPSGVVAVEYDIAKGEPPWEPSPSTQATPSSR